MSASVASSLDVSFAEEQFVATAAAQGFFNTGEPIWIARAPGRLDVMGGNVDYTGGMVLQGLLCEAIWVAVQPQSNQTIRVLNPQAEGFGWAPYLELSVADLATVDSLRKACAEREGWHWGLYVFGCLHFLRNCYGCGHFSGMNIFIASDLPPNKGVSSSAALEVAVLKACAAAGEVRLSGVALATAGQWVENVVAGAACGIMDQAAIVLGRENCLLPMLCQACQPYAPILLPAGICIWGIDSTATRSTSSAAYEKARAAAFMGYKLICQGEGLDVVMDKGSAIARWTDSRWNGYLSNATPSEFRSRFERRLPESLSGAEFLAMAGVHVDPFTSIDPWEEYPVRSAVRYATEENHRVRSIYALFEAGSAGLSEGSLQLAGELFYQSHLAYGECGLGSTECDELVERARRAGFAGAKMTGGGGGGVVAILGRVGNGPAIQAIAHEFAAEHDQLPHIFEGSSMGVDAFSVRDVLLSSTW